MIEKVYELYMGNEKSIKRIIADENINYNQMVLNKGEALPEHYSNSNVYMTIVRGAVTIKLDDNDSKRYPKGTILNIPNGIKMNVRNEEDETLELFVVKSPAP